MKRVMGLFIIMVIFFLLNVTIVSAGALRKNSIKTCPNGVKYGYYVSGGVNHWHKAEECDSFSGWCPDGEELSGDPCPNNNVSNQNTTKETTTTTKAATSRTTIPTTTTTTSTTTITEQVTTTETTKQINETKTETKKESEYSDSSDDGAGIIGGIFALGAIGTGIVMVKKKLK